MRINVRVEGELSDKEPLERGTPQGSIQSPLLFSIIINGLPEALSGSGMVISQFADDSSTWKSGSNVVKLAKDAQAGMDSLWRWVQKWGFKISDTKTVGILFGNKNMHNLSASLGGKQIQVVQTVQFLGFILDKKLTFRENINDLVYWM